MQPINNINGSETHPFKPKAKGVATETLNWVESEIDSIKEIGSKSLGEVNTLVQNAVNEASTQFSAFARRTTALVKKYPLTSAAVAIGVGYLVTRAMVSRNEHASHVPLK